ncbi:MAG: DUF2497 domain-containing protein [Tabrizicola sp.]|nr:DUF2497 domain-containing protein [Tabrizicola sp.]
MSSPEIEDVVSSIRRLVSRDLSHNRLILTPALRVVSDSQQPLPDEPVAAEPAVAEDMVPPLVPPAPMPQDEMIAEADEMSGGAPVEIEPEWGEKIWEEPPIPLAELAIEVEEAELLPSGSDVLWPETPEPDAWPDVGEEPVVWEQDDGGWTSDKPAVEPPAAEPEPVAAVEVPLAVAAVPVADPAPVVTRKPRRRASETAPAAPAKKAPAPRTRKLRSATAAKVKKAAAAAATPVARKAPTIADDDFGLGISEEVLQEMVRDLIRDELQGTLGEKITRNVRRLVRAEINRAFAARDLD